MRSGGETAAAPQPVEPTSPPPIEPALEPEPRFRHASAQQPAGWFVPSPRDIAMQPFATAWTHLGTNPGAPLPMCGFPIAIPAFHMERARAALDSELELEDERRREAAAADDDEREPPIIMHCAALAPEAAEDPSSTIFSLRVGKLTMSSLGRTPRRSRSAARDTLDHR